MLIGHPELRSHKSECPWRPTEESQFQHCYRLAKVYSQAKPQGEVMAFHIIRAVLIFLLGVITLANGADQRNLGLTSGKIGEKRIALVIGNAAYGNSPLKNPVNDARAVAAQLSRLGFEVVKRENLTTKQIGSTLREFRSRLTPGSEALFFYAGHGLQVKGVNYLPAVDAEISSEEDVPNQSINVNQLLEIMDDAKTRLNLVFLDACRNNPFTRRFRSVGGGLAKIEAPSGTKISFATRPGSVAADGAGSNGLYTEYLLRVMDERGLPIEQALKKIYSGVKKASNGAQEPWEEGTIEGDFYFRGGLSGTTPDSATPSAVNSPDTPSNDRAFWDSVKESKIPDEYKAYLDQYPNGLFASLARTRLAALQPNQVAAMAPTNIAMHSPRFAMNEGLITDVLSRLEKSYVVPPDYPTLVRGGAQELERNLLKGKLNISDSRDGLTLNLSANRGSPVLLNTPTTASDAQRQLIVIGNLAQEADSTITASRIEESLLRGALTTLDPYSDFLSPERYRELQIGISGTFGGAGIEIGMRDGWPYVIAPIDGTPASRVGLLAGDRIAAVDGFVTHEVSLADIVGRMRGAPGSRLVLNIQREGWDMPHDLEIVREMIRVESVRSRELEPGIGYIKISQFQQDTPQRLQEVLDSWKGSFMSAAKVNGLILDLRNNPGGVLNAVIDVAGKFLPEGQLVLSTESRLMESRLRYTVKPSNKQIDTPMVLLINKGTASGSEVLTAALQDGKRALVVGDRTFGKGTVQTILPIAGGYALKLTTAEFRSPNRRSFTGTGINPDLFVLNQIPVPGADSGEDLQLKTAVLQLKKMIDRR